MGVKAAVSQPGFLHDLGHADTRDARAAHGAGGGVKDTLVRLLVARGPGHGAEN
jgi:hypothetical protein